MESGAVVISQSRDSVIRSIAEFECRRISLPDLALLLEDVVAQLERIGWVKAVEFRRIWFDIEIINAVLLDTPCADLSRELDPLLDELLGLLV